MLSILIPIYNYNVYPLVLELHKQCLECGIDFEILVLDDGSSLFYTENQKINLLSQSNYTILEKNCGRSAIRNLLSQKATFDNLLFLDADTFPCKDNFVSKYVNLIDKGEKIIYGGIKYQNEKPSQSELLRWIYGNSREALSANKREENPYLTFLTLNFLIKKSIFDKVKFNEKIPNLRHEDTLFSYDLMKAKITINHIENSVYHLGLENSKTFLKKSEEALINLKYLFDNYLMDSNYLKISRSYNLLKKMKMDYLFFKIFKISNTFLLKNILSKNPSLLLFDIYRLGYYCGLKSSQNV